MKTEIKVCTIGGGSGMPIINRSLVNAGFKSIRSIVTTFDSGGDSGRMRTDERGRILAFSDYWRSLMSLWIDGKQKDKWLEMLRYRDGRGRNFGNTFFQFLAERSGGLDNVDELFSELTGAELAGKVVPVSVSPADVCFKTQSGKEYKGEHHLDDLRMSFDKVEKIWLEPKVKATKEADEVLSEADVIIICPGSMYGSVLTNFLPLGMGEAYRKSKAKKILMTNIMSVANENDSYTQDDYCKVFQRYLKAKSPFDLVIMVDLMKLDSDKLQKALGYYELEHSFPIKFNASSKNPTLLADLAVLEEQNFRLRHSEAKLSRLFKELEI